MFTDMGTGFKENYITAGNVLRVLPKIKDKISAYDYAKVEACANSMGTRLMNLKHFLGFMRQDSVFKKFMGP